MNSDTNKSDLRVQEARIIGEMLKQSVSEREEAITLIKIEQKMKRLEKNEVGFLENDKIDFLKRLQEKKKQLEDLIILREVFRQLPKKYGVAKNSSYALAYPLTRVEQDFSISLSEELIRDIIRIYIPISEQKKEESLKKVFLPEIYLPRSRRLIQFADGIITVKNILAYGISGFEYLDEPNKKKRRL